LCIKITNPQIFVKWTNTAVCEQLPSAEKPKSKSKGSHQMLARLHVDKIQVTTEAIHIYSPAGFHSDQLCHTWRKKTQWQPRQHTG